MTEEQYISFETAKLAKEKGFNGNARYAFGFDGSEGLPFEKEILMPTQAVLARWLRETYKLFVSITVDFLRCISSDNTKYYSVFQFHIVNLKNSSVINNNKDYETYEEALEAGLQEALKQIESEEIK